MTYVVTVDARTPAGAPEMDRLQRVGAVVLLEDGFDAVEGVDGPEGTDVDVLDRIVAVHPGGALLKVFVDAAALEFAEEAVRAVVDEVLERSELLADWTVERCEVELHPDEARESLAAADGPDVPPADPAARKARHAQEPAAGGAGGYDPRARAGQVRERMLALADVLPPEAFGADGDAALAAGAVVYAAELLVDEVFEDVQTLTEEEATVADCEGDLWHLDELPERHALEYDALFARRFLVTVVALTTRLTDGSFRRPGCVAEELALRLLLDAAATALDTFGLLAPGVSTALAAFARTALADADFAWLTDDAPSTPASIASWFTPFTPDHYAHPYTTADPDDGGV